MIYAILEHQVEERFKLSTEVITCMHHKNGVSRYVRSAQTGSDLNA